MESINALIVCMLSSAVTYAIDEPSMHLAVAKKVTKDGITLAAHQLLPEEVKKLLHSSLFETKNYQFIQCTIKNSTDADFVIKANTLGLKLLNANQLVDELYRTTLTFTTLRALTSSILPYFPFSVSKVDIMPEATYQFISNTPNATALVPAITPSVLPWAGLAAFQIGVNARWSKLAAYPLLFLGPVGNLIFAMAYSPAAIWTVAAVDMYQAYKIKQVLKNELKALLLAPGSTVVVQPETIKSFLLALPSADKPMGLTILTINGLIIAIG